MNTAITKSIVSIDYVYDCIWFVKGTWEETWKVKVNFVEKTYPEFNKIYQRTLKVRYIF